MFQPFLPSRAALVVAATCLTAFSGTALAQHSTSPTDDPVAALRMTEQMTLLKELTAAHGPGLIPPTTSATILNYTLPGGGLLRRMVISRSKNFSPSMDMATGQIFVPADGPMPHGGPPVDCTGSATITVLARELSSRETRFGDLNCDGVMQNSDVSALSLALVDPAGYAAAYPGCNPLNGDMNFDTLLDGKDIAVFADHLLSPVTADVPVRLRYRLGAEPSQDLMAGQDVLVNDSDQATLVQGQEFIISARMAYPGFSAGGIAAEVLSDSVTNVMILVNGDNYPQMAALKGVQNPYGSQQSVAQILGPTVLDPVTGIVTLPANQAVFLFELGTTNVSSPAYDMQDLVLRMTTDCDLLQEVVLRNSIGVDDTSTNGNFPFATYGTTGSPYYIVPAELTAPQSMTLSTLRIIVAKMTSPLILENLDYYVRVWSDLPTAIAQPNNGNIANLFFDSPTSGPTSFGVTGNLPSAGGITTTYSLSFDLQSNGIVLNSGQGAVVGVSVANSGCAGGQNGCLGIVETTEFLPSDIQISNNITGGWRLVSSSIYSLHHGRVAWDVRGIAN